MLKVDRLPRPGETIGASTLEFFPGGKGANQAASAAKLGWPTVLIGQLGNDSNADALESALGAAGVQLQHVQRVDGPSGTAVILLQDSGGRMARLNTPTAACWEWQATSGMLTAVPRSGVPEQHLHHCLHRLLVWCCCRRKQHHYCRRCQSGVARQPAWGNTGGG